MKAGYAEVDITPPLGVELSGYGFFLGRRATGVNDRLYARALWLESEERMFLLVSCDLVGLGPELVRDLKKQVEDKLGLSRRAVLYTCTHTHTGPATVYLRGCGQIDPGYIEELREKLFDVACRASEDTSRLEEIYYGEAEANRVAHNRVYSNNQPLDEKVRTVTLHREDSRPLVIANFGCHPVACGIESQISADFPGVVVRELKELGYKCIYTSGFCGDIDPKGKPRGFAQVCKTGKLLAEGVKAALKKGTLLSDPGLRCGIRDTSLPLDIGSSAEIVSQLAEARDRLLEKPNDRGWQHRMSWLVDSLKRYHVPDFKSSVDVQVQAFVIGGLVFVALPGEIFSAFGFELREAFPDLDLITLNTANGVVGYIPTPDEYSRQGYAAYRAAGIYNEFQFLPDVGRYLTACARELIADFQ